MVRAVKGSRGFSLIELLVVIAIIGILSSVVLTSLNTARAKARDARRISDIKQVQLALELYYDANNFYPENSWATLSSGLTGTFMSQVPNDPGGGSKSYGYYATPSSCDNEGATPCNGYYIGSIFETPGQTGPLSSDLDTDLGGNNITVNGAATNCNALAGQTTEVLYCTGAF